MEEDLQYLDDSMELGPDDKEYQDKDYWDFYYMAPSFKLCLPLMPLVLQIQERLCEI